MVLLQLRVYRQAVWMAFWCLVGALIWVGLGIVWLTVLQVLV